MCSIIAEMSYVPAFRNVVLRPQRRLFPGRPGTQRTAIIGFSLILCAVCLSFSALDAATINAASNSYADVNTAVNTVAARGDTVVVPAGSGTVTWTSNLTITKGVFLRGPGRDSLTIINNGAINIVADATAIANEETIRVEGFTFDGNNSALNIITVRGSGSTAAKPYKNLAIGNNRLKNTGNVTSGSGAVRINGQVRGAIFNNIFDRCNVLLKIAGNNDAGAEWLNDAYYHFATNPSVYGYGSSDNLFVENNTFQWSTTFSGGDPGWIESLQGGRVVVRYNTFNFANAAGANDLWDIHGFQNWPGNGQTGTMIVEYYGNRLINTNAWYLWVAHRGSWGLFHNNILTGNNGGGIFAQQYGVGDIGGSGCTAEVPGATGNYIAEINNTYVFNNTVNSAVSNMQTRDLGSGHPGCDIAENANFWNYNPAFNGTAGIGRGTTTPTMSATNGVGYWKCSTVTPTTDPAIVQTGHFYKRVAGAWVDYYTPYTYPHPLVTGAPLPTPTPGPSSTPTPIPGPTSTPGPSPTSTPTPPPLGPSFPATTGVITNPFVINGNAISQLTTTIDPTQGGRALYTFNVATSGDYLLSALVDCPDGGSNSLFVNINGEPTTAMVWNIAVTSGPENRVATWSPSTAPKSWTLAAGTHQLIIRGREANTVLQHITLGIAPTAPEGLHVVP